MTGVGGPEVGLCDRCRHQQIVRNTRGSVFSLCRRSRDEPDRFPRYPRLPVLRCPGYEPRESDGSASPQDAKRSPSRSEGSAGY
ncbi:MAG TPA: hypothetical protein VGI07_10515 [Solirubrobacteraceae bacterium]